VRTTASVGHRPRGVRTGSSPVGRRVRETVPVARDSPDCDDASSADNGGIFARNGFHTVAHRPER
jgi:hypothetical protein